MKFQEMNLNHSLLHGLKQMGMETATEIQERAIPEIIDSPDTHIIAQARTGSGKTLAFAIPLAEKIDNTLQTVQSVIIVPTRELCKQVAEVFVKLTKYRHIKVVQVYGGVSIDRQVQEIQEGAQIIVATPGRLIDLFNRRRVSFTDVKFVVLDEADRCLDMGFMPDIEFLLLDAMRDVHPRLILFSATMLDAVYDLTKRFTGDKNVIEIDVSQDSMTVENCNQYYYLIDDFKDKYYHFIRIIRQEKPIHCMIFVNTKRTGDWLYQRFQNEERLPLKPELISGNLTQRRREIVLDKFRKRKINCLIATDVAARGLDVEKVSHVFNYDIPEFEENYVHRIGRTARISNASGKVAKGIAISLVMNDQMRTLSRIEGFMSKDIEKRPLPQRRQYSSSNRQSSGSHSERHLNTDHPARRNRNNPKRTYKKSGPKKNDRKKPDRRNFLY
ncbi:putative ATP-dependent RNA helicase [Candidatus Lokiarchaeum ossiferum]